MLGHHRPASRPMMVRFLWYLDWTPFYKNFIDRHMKEAYSKKLFALIWVVVILGVLMCGFIIFTFLCYVGGSNNAFNSLYAG